MKTRLDSFETRSTLPVGSASYDYFSLRKFAASAGADIERLPISLKVLLENLLRHEDGVTVSRADILALATWNPREKSATEIGFTPARVLLQDFTGVPAVVDLAAMREAMRKFGGNPARINPLQPVDLVIDHSVQVDSFGTPQAFAENARLELERNRERYAFLRWGQRAFSNFSVVPPDTGIVHQINLEYLAPVVFAAAAENGGSPLAYFDTLVGTDSHTPMVNSLGVVGWGVGGIEAEAAMLGQPISMLIPEVVGFNLTGSLKPGATATDLVLTVTQVLRAKGVVGKFVEFYGAGLSSLSLADRATISNMAPEYGATIGFFPVDAETLNYLRFSGRSAETVARVEAYSREQGVFRTDATPAPQFSDSIALDLATVEPSLAGPKRPQDRIALSSSKKAFRKALYTMVEDRMKNVNRETIDRWLGEGGHLVDPAAQTAAPHDIGELGKTVAVPNNGSSFVLGHGSVVIAAITSCTNTSNPSVMIAAGLLARNAVARGLRVKPWVKTSLAPGSKVVTDYLEETKLMPALEQLGFHLVGYGCTTCIGNSGPLLESVGKAVAEGDLIVAAVLSGNRNFEGRINPQVQANYLASPPLVVAYAIAGSMDTDLTRDPLGYDGEGKPVFLSDIWPAQEEVTRTISGGIKAEMFIKQYADVFTGDETWRSIPIPEGVLYTWAADSTYVKHPPYFEDMPAEPPPLADITAARVLAVLGDSVTTDHISPAGSIKKDGPAGQYLIERGVEVKDFNSYGARRGNHEVMLRGTFANIRLRNLLAPGTEGGWTLHLPGGERMSIYDAAMRYQAGKTPLVILAGREYGSGSSRDWAAKGTRLLGVRAVIAEGYERIHRSNLIGMGVLPLQFLEGENAAGLGLNGHEIFDIRGIAEGLAPGKKLRVFATAENGATRKFGVLCRIDTPYEVDYYRHGGILHYVLRSLMKS